MAALSTRREQQLQLIEGAVDAAVKAGKVQPKEST